MISIVGKVLQNTKGKNYKLCTIEFLGVNNTLQQSTASIYEACNQNGVKVNSKYSAIATIVGDEAYLNVTEELYDLEITILSISPTLNINGKKNKDKYYYVRFIYQNEIFKSPARFPVYILDYGLEVGKKYRVLCKNDFFLEIFEIIACVY